MKHKASKHLLSFIVLVLSLFLIFKIIPNTLASAEVYEIYTFEDLVKYAELSRTSGYQDDIYKLMNDITITEENQNTLESSDFNYISFGSSDVPFSGTFDGQGYTIYNLSYSADLSVKTDTGLISETTTGAVIKNLTISNADVQSDYRGGIVVGKATGTLFENIVVKDSHLFVSATDNVLTLITDGGIRGGAVVGEAFDSVLYNCEVNNTIVNTNNTSGVAALSGKGLTLGGLVGKSDNTEIEYSRVIDGSVKNYYDVAVGALGGNTLYVGGIVGQMSNGSKVIDSFSTATLYFYCATYVSVGAGNSGHIGGITAAMNGDKNEIIRSHYAGVATSRQYNAVLVIPIIQDNVNISGIANIYDGGSVVNTYFKSSMNPDVDMKVLGNSTTTSSYGPQSDDRYASKEFWQSAYYDLNGSIERSSNYDSKHYNRWVMDTDLGIPVHGKAISATLNFKDAGVVTISKSELINNSVSTSNPYEFAVQGFKPSEIMVSINATENDGYRFIAWYKKEGVPAWKLDNYEYFEEIFSENEPISNEKNNNIIFEDNDLYIAYYQAKVLFHDIEGNVINPTTGVVETDDNEDNWYDYQDSFPSVIPDNKPSSSTATLIGWTTKEGGYSAISTAELNALKSNGTFYELDGEVTKTLSLYPVYADLISNITTIFEGNELDSSSNISLRENVGYTTSTMNDNSEVVISALGYGENNSFPTGYRFLGWYDENNNRVSSDAIFTLDNYDLTETHAFTARLKYKVDYYGTTTKFYDNSDFDGNPFEEPSVSIWYEYNESFVDMGSSVVLEQGDSFAGWYLGMGSVPHSSDDYDSCNGVSTSKKITEPFSVHAHVSGDSSNYEIYLISDFPNAGVITTENSPATVEFIVNMTEIKDGYNFLFWASGRDNGNRQETSTSPTDFDSGGVFLSTADYGYEAHLDANVVFHNKTSATIATVTRRYEEKVFSDSDITYQYTWPIEQSNIDITISDKNVTNGVHTSKAYPYNLSDSNLYVEGYRFIGWVDKNSLSASEWDYIYGTSGGTYSVGTDPYVTESIPLATPYLLTEDDICISPMDIYPVYVKYDIITKTNISSENLTIDINVPSNPTYVIEENGSLYADITLTVDLDTYVIGSSGEKYTLTSFTLVDDEGNKEVIEAENNGTYKYKVSPDITYTFVANYEPLVVIYHLNDTDTDVVIKSSGTVLGKGKDPTYDIASIMDDSANMYIFAGWSKEVPTNNKYHKYNNYDEISELVDESMLVTHSMDLYPVYVKVNINVNTNIDTYIEEKGIVKESIRTISRDSISNASLEALNTNIDNYYFIGWYKNYVDENNLGEELTTNATYILEETENYESITYTAVYKKMYNINYYGKNGSIIYSTIVEHEDNRTFVKKQEDINGNIVETPIDYEAILEINKTLELNEIFKTWQWVKSDGTIVSWDNFYNNQISEDMNLYPIIVKTTATDYNGNSVDVTNTPDIILGVSDNTIFAGLNLVYEGSQLTLHVDEVSYNNTTTTVMPLEGVKMIVYPHSTTDDDYIGSQTTNSNGDAIFNFNGMLTIVKEKNTNSKDTDTFIYKIADKDNPQEIIKIIAVKNGESVDVIVPYGQYIVYEDSIWYWRYNNTTSANLTVNNYNNDKVTFNNIISNNKWFDGMNTKNNKYR